MVTLTAENPLERHLQPALGGLAPRWPDLSPHPSLIRKEREGDSDALGPRGSGAWTLGSTHDGCGIWQAWGTREPGRHPGAPRLGPGIVVGRSCQQDARCRVEIPLRKGAVRKAAGRPRNPKTRDPKCRENTHRACASCVSSETGYRGKARPASPDLWPLGDTAPRIPTFRPQSVARFRWNGGNC